MKALGGALILWAAACSSAAPDAATASIDAAPAAAPDAPAATPDAPAAAPDAASAAPDAAPDGPVACAATPTSYVDLSRPADGEWPKFKRSLDNRGLAAGTSALADGNTCTKWMRKVTGDVGPGYPPRGIYGRNATGVVVGQIAGQPVVFVSVMGGCDLDTCWTSGDGVPGNVYAIDGPTGAVLWRTPLVATIDGESIVAGADIYAPVLADLDGDCKRELIVNASNAPVVFVLRTEAEGGEPAGSIKKAIRYSTTPGEASEAAPTVVDIDGDGKLDVLLGSGGGGDRAHFYAMDPIAGTVKGTPFQTRASRRERDNAARTAQGFATATTCPDIEKMDSSSPTVATLGGKPTVFVGSWDGSFYGLQWSGGALVSVLEDELPVSASASDQCVIRKVRSGAVAIPDGDAVDLVFGYMPVVANDQNLEDFAAAWLRVLRAVPNAAQFTVVAGAVDDPGWKSTPSAAQTGATWRVAGGSTYGAYFVELKPATSEVLTARRYGPETDRYGDADSTLGGWGGNRSSPAFATIDGLLTSVQGIEGEDRPGVTFFDAATGAERWRWTAPADRPAPGPTPTPVPELPFTGVTAGIAVAQLDPDPSLEVVFLGLDGVVYALDTCP
jgi:outer membrane protein assembly factor BamB